MPTPRKVQATVDSIEQYADDLYILTLKPQGRVPRFKAGNFLHLAIDDYDPAMAWPDSRAFSIANSPKSAGLGIRLIFSRIGAFTGRMANELKVGSHVWIRLPYGDFHVIPEVGRTQVLVAGGSGISPFVSFLEQAVDEGLESPVRLFFGVRSPNHFVALDAIRIAEEKLANFKCHYFVENPGEALIPGVEEAPGVKVGRLSLSEILLWTDSQNSDYYLSGPPAMIESFQTGIIAEGVPGDRVFCDDW